MSGLDSAKPWSTNPTTNEAVYTYLFFVGPAGEKDYREWLTRQLLRYPYIRKSPRLAGWIAQNLAPDLGRSLRVLLTEEHCRAYMQGHADGYKAGQRTRSEGAS